MSTLIVTLPCGLPTAAVTCASVLTADGRTVLRHDDTPLALLPPTQDAGTVVVVPVACLSWHQVTLPKGTLARHFLADGGAARLRSVLDGLLEDLLLDEPTRLHLALAPAARDDAPTWVAACDRAWLQAWLGALENVGRPVTRIVPELAPTDVPSLHVIGSPDAPQVVHGHANGVTCLPLSATTAALVAWPEAATVLAEPAVADIAQTHFATNASLQTRHQRAIVAAQSAWDLAQFDLLRTRGARTRKHMNQLWMGLLHAPQWRPARWAAVALVGLNLIGLQAWAWKQQSALAAKREAIRTTLTATFPDVRVVVDAPLQMRRAVADLQRASGTASGADFETMLGQYQALAPAKQAPSAIEYIAGELRLTGVDGISSPPVPGYDMRLDGDSVVLKQDQSGVKP